MSNIETGGPAFPLVAEAHEHVISTGMTLRDYFAAKAPITWQDAIEYLDTYGGEVVGPWPPGQIMETLVLLQIEYADFMLKAGNQS
jgi:hypothetical protein